MHLAESGGCVTGGRVLIGKVQAQTDNQRPQPSIFQRSGGWGVMIDMETQLRFEVCFKIIVLSLS